MSLFNPDKLFTSLVGAMGLQPGQIQQFVIEVITEVRELRAERLAFKAGVQAKVPELFVKVDILERKLDSILLFLHAMPPLGLVPRPLVNPAGHDYDAALSHALIGTELINGAEYVGNSDHPPGGGYHGSDNGRAEHGDTGTG